MSTTGWNPVLLGQISTVGFHSTPFSTLGNVGLLRCTDGSAGYGSTYALDDILIDPAAAANDQPTADLRGFAILVSTTTPDDPHQVFAGRCAQAAGLQRFSLPAGTRAKYVELDAIDNDGGSRLAVAEFEVYGRPVSAGAWLRPALRTDVKKAPNTAALASVRTIRSGLAVQPPKKHQVRSSPAPDRRGTTAYQRPASPLRGQLIGR